MLYLNKKTLFAFAFPLFVHAQDKGIKFEEGSLSEIFAKAKKENKYVFIDCYTTWCVPCKFMEHIVFPLEEVGSFYNDHFVSAAFQFDSTKNDSQEIKDRYKDIASLRSTYNVKAYPTYLFFNPSGELVDRNLGQSGFSEFIQKGRDALNPQKQYYTQLKRYTNGDRDSAYLRDIAMSSLRTLDDSLSALLTKEYISRIHTLNNPSNLQFIFETTKNVTDTGFQIMLNNLEIFENLIGKDKLRNYLVSIVTDDELIKNNYFKGFDPQSRSKYLQDLFKKYPLFKDQLILSIQTTVSLVEANWAQYVKSVDLYIVKNDLEPKQLNEFAWTIFKSSTDSKLLKRALGWSKRSFTNQEIIDPGFIDTYANLLYKTGKVKKAIQWERKAQHIAVSQGAAAGWGQETIEKFIKGEKTW